MLLEEIKNIKSGKIELRKFGITLGIVFGLFGGLFLWRGKPYYFFLFVLSGIFLFFGFLLPLVLKPIHKIWMMIALVFGSIMTKVILCVLFYLAITPLGLLLRLSGKDFLDLKFDKSANTYWIQKKQVPFEKANYEKQF